ncbi:MAG: efflux RND transporter permease subunit [Myxococcota bacterium]
MTHAPHQSESRLFRGLATLVLRHRLAFAALVLAITAFLAHATATRLMIDNSVELFMPDDDPSFRALEDLRDAFGRDQFFLVLVEGDVFSRDYLERLHALRESVRAFSPEVASLGERRRDRDARRGAISEAPPAESEPDAFGDFEGDDGSGWGDEAGGTVVDQIISVLDVRRTWMDGDTLRVDSWLDPLPADDAELAARAKAMLAEPTLVGQVLATDGRASMLAVRTRFMSEEDSDRLHFQLHDLLEAHQAPGFRVLLGGGPSIDAVVNAMMLRDMLTLVGGSTLAMLAVLFFLFRRVVAVIAPIVVVTLATIWTSGLMALTGMPLGMLSSMLPAFLFVVGIGDSVHVLAVHATRRRAGVEPTQAIIDAVAATGMPVLFTTLTTMVGLASFHFAAVVAIRQLGYAGAFGVGMALLNTLVVLPLALSFIGGDPAPERAKPARDPARPDLISRFLVFCFGLSEPRPGAPTLRRNLTLAASAALFVLSLFGVAQLRVAHDPLEWFDADVEVRVATERIDATIGGMATANVLIEATEPGTLRDVEVLHALAAFERHVLDYREPGSGEAIVHNATSILDPLRETHRALHGGGRDAWRLPEDQRSTSDLMLLFENAGPSELTRLMNADATLADMTFRASWREASAYGPLIAHIDAGIARYIEPLAGRITARSTGGVYTFFSVVTTLVSDLARSFGVALIVITLLMAVFLRDLRLGLIAMVPNLLPIVFVIAFMGATGIPIDLNSLLIASIAIGIAVDDTIHLLHHFEAHLDRGASVEAALLAARRDAGRAVVATSLLLMLGFFIFAGAEIEPVRRFGVLVGLTVVMAILTDLITLPALLRFLYRKRPVTEESPA